MPPGVFKLSPICDLVSIQISDAAAVWILALGHGAAPRVFWKFSREVRAFLGSPSAVEILGPSPSRPGSTLPHAEDLAMHTRLLIDAIVRQTMVAIAQLSTTDGVRSPLSHVADRVFLDLVEELERQGVGKKVIADMFGLALRSYQQKVQRLTESATDEGVSLWAAVKKFLEKKRVARKAEVLTRFCNDDGASVRGILKDLVTSGLVVQTGRGESAEYRVATDDDGAREPHHQIERNAAVTWVHVYQDGPITRSALLHQLPLSDDQLDAALRSLVADGRISKTGTNGESRYSAERCLIPVENEAGWEAAVMDHHRAVMTALALKVRGGAPSGTTASELGGSTFVFDLCPNHPHEAEARALLLETREKMSHLWDKVVAHNGSREKADDDYKVTFYFGQAIHHAGTEETS